MSESAKNAQKTNPCDLPGNPIETLGEVFADGSFIEVVHDPADRDALNLMLFDGETAQIGPRVEHENQVYVPREIDPTVVRELHLPADFRPNESVPQLAADMAHLGQKYCGIKEEAAELMARFFLADWVMDALPSAPSLVVIGPESREVMQVLALTKCLARHTLPVMELTPNDLCSFPTELGLTLAIDQPGVKGNLGRLLNASRQRMIKVPHRRSLWSPFFSKVVFCADQFQASLIKGAKLVVAPNGHPIPLLDDREQARIAHDFQPRLLSYRFANYATVRARIIEESASESAAPAPVSALPLPGFDDAELHAKIRDLVADSVIDASEDRWTDPSSVLLECLVMSCHLPNQRARYMGQIADEMMTLLSARGEERKILPKQVGRMIRDLGFETEPRDKQGVKLLLTEAVRKKIHKLAYDFAVSSIENPVPGCRHCDALGKKTA